MTPARPMGHRYDPPGRERGREIGHLVGGIESRPDSVDLGGRVTEVIAQRGQSCVSASFWLLAMLAAYASGTILDPSTLAPYAGARMLEVPGAEVLADVGCYPNLLARFVEQWGLVSRARWPDSSDLSAPVPFDVLEAGALASCAGGVFRVYEERPDDKLARIEQTLAAGFGVAGAMPIDQRYVDGPGALYSAPYGPAIGDHCQTVIGYVRRARGRPGKYKIRGSWGRDWNLGGDAWVDEDVIVDLWRDCQSLRIVPRVLR